MNLRRAFVFGAMVALVLPTAVVGQTGAPPKPMAGDADVAFKKATIKPENRGVSLHGFEYDGKTFKTHNTSLVDLISYAYEVQAKQIIGGPDWGDTARYDITATMDQKGEPSPQQLRVMFKRLLADRFKLIYHPDKRGMPAYVVTVAKDGPKLTPTGFNAQLGELSLSHVPDGLTISVRNAALEDFTVYLQLIVLDRPVVDLTGLKGKFDFQVMYKPDASESGGQRAKPPAQKEWADPLPDLPAAMQQQIGLDLVAEDLFFVDVMVIDGVERPTVK